MNPERQGEWWECHPEVAFAQLNSGVALKATKKSEEGQAERMSFLADLPGVNTALERASRITNAKTAPDDCIDALVCLLTAERDPHQRILIPATPDKDERGLTMGIMAPA